ncbi:MAG: MGH1-like glycoside hydrolase domain-containing protein, partial [Prolixibacteraceae bacterium]
KGGEFDASYPIPSLAKNEAAFNPGQSVYIWRGPTWIVNNWFLHKYLLKKNHNKEAKTLINSILNLISKSGFREYYNPFTGEGYGARDFTWGGLVLDMLHDEKHKK